MEKKMLRYICSFLSLVSIATGGCVNGTQEEAACVEDAAAKTSTTYAVVVGVERSLFAGDCPGAKMDSSRMFALVSRYATKVKLLQDENATHVEVKAAIARGVEASGTGLFVLYYSGHGGSEPFPDTGIEEKDGCDEFLCLYDTYMRDNEIWGLLSKSRGRVLWITDSCHSETQFRAPFFCPKPPLSFDHVLNESHPFSLLCWSGCPDSDYSYGSSTGGQFTNALLKYFSDGITYQSLWNKIKTDSSLRRYESPQSTVIGRGFDERPFLR